MYTTQKGGGVKPRSIQIIKYLHKILKLKTPIQQDMKRRYKLQSAHCHFH